MKFTYKGTECDTLEAIQGESVCGIVFHKRDWQKVTEWYKNHGLAKRAAKRFIDQIISNAKSEREQ